jgi:DNA-binding transcriptional MerR regulator
LHHYDAMGLLKPTRVTEAGYRLYDDTALARLHTILLLRQLQFPLKQIKEILDSPGFEPMDALQEQITLLEMQRQHLDELIAHARQIREKGEIPMSFNVFDTTAMEEYAAEAKAKWGKTEAYQEFEKKGKPSGDALMEVFAQIGRLRNIDPASPEAQAAVAKLQQFITDHYYTCTKQILRGLGQMYVADERFQQNIDRAGGEGTVAFVSRAIEIYCSK